MIDSNPQKILFTSVERVSLSKALYEQLEASFVQWESWLQYANLNLLNWRIYLSFRHHTDIREKCM